MPVSTVCIHDPVGEASPAADRTEAVRVVDAAAPGRHTVAGSRRYRGSLWVTVVQYSDRRRPGGRGSACVGMDQPCTAPVYEPGAGTGRMPGA